MLCLFPRETKVPQIYPYTCWLELHHIALPKPVIGKGSGITIVGLVNQNWPLGWGWGPPSPTSKAIQMRVEVWTNQGKEKREGRYWGGATNILFFF